jgi:acetoin utilization deacetylase AcuC-like enzyme
MIPVFYSESYVLARYEFDTTRKARWVSESLGHRPVPGARLVEPEALGRELLAEVHDESYIEAVRTGQPRGLAESQGFPWDPGLWDMVLASNGGAVAAALAALRSGSNAGSLSSGLHHARRDRGAGFCTFNGLACAARATLRAGAGSVLIVDLDAHCGGGTHSLLGHEGRVRQLDIAVDGFDSYTPSNRTTLDRLDDAGAYLPTLERRLEGLDSTGASFDLCLYNAGMDPFEACPIGGLAGMTPALLLARDRTVFAWCASRRIPVAFVLAGGYIAGDSGRDRLVELHRGTIVAAVHPAP